MEKNALKVKANFEALKKLGLELTSLGEWLPLILKCGLYETTIEPVYNYHDTALAIANDPSHVPGPDFQKFVQTQYAAVSMKKALVTPVDNLLKKRAKLLTD